jgi:DNA invertase Pin-like site-specific DNA recombinase
MRAAIYARKSNDDDRSDENKSITRQRERAAYAKGKGWTVDPDHVFEDDGISGAEFERRSGLLKMLARLKEFDVIVTSELSRLGRDTVRTPVVIDDIRTAGKRIFYYLTDEEEKADTPEAQVMVALKSFGAALERAKIAERTRDALSRKAEHA